MSIQDHAVIYLEPGEGDPFTGREWCEDDNWSGSADYDYVPPTKYVRADIVSELVAAVRAALVNYIGCGIITWTHMQVANAAIAKAEQVA